MSALLDTCLSNSRASGTARLVLLILARGANQRGYTRIPAATIAKLCGKSDQMVRTCLLKLCDLKEIARVEQGGGRCKATVYQILVKRKHPLPDLRIPTPDFHWEPPY